MHIHLDAFTTKPTDSPSSDGKLTRIMIRSHFDSWPAASTSRRNRDQSSPSHRASQTGVPRRSRMAVDVGSNGVYGTPPLAGARRRRGRAQELCEPVAARGSLNPREDGESEARAGEEEDRARASSRANGMGRRGTGWLTGSASGPGVQRMALMLRDLRLRSGMLGAVWMALPDDVDLLMCVWRRQVRIR
ncbi:uncharacterized protein B0H18DRAFT_1115982 [Fomitopsis serialis]|uniref:uncharacterized protein n=1 Tax=Fomitopsis serialis TaxID=139415 RepID=UPI0020083053|nr:uncharacterized protein B0H18DRAFT_1115982 [Neoantrodia serialis]KAH9932315.1 hypothetical protein B0H18DRAFT_1115982 [Neoantrodia serialis]